MGGMIGVGGATDSRSNLLAISSDDLIGLITSTIGSDTWDEVGGPGSIEIVGGMLVVRNDDAVQAQVGELLNSFREMEERGRLVTLKARLLRLTAKQLLELTNQEPAGSVKPEVLDKLSETPSLAYCGQLSCLNGQTSFVALGKRHTVAASSIPVVGGQAAGYSVQTVTPNAGALIELTTLVLPGAERAVIDVHAVVTAMLESQPMAVSGAGIDRVQVAAAQLATTVRVDLGKPFLVGGLTDTQAMADDDKLAEQQQFYLVLEVQ
jgi:hypothetical protein